MLEFEGCDDSKQAVIKTECSDAENVVENITNCPENEDILRIKCEEIDIKEELDIEAEIGNYSFASSNKNIRKSDLEEIKHFCPKCPCFSNRKDDIKRHMRLHLDNKQYKCVSLKVHLSSQEENTKEFDCHKCHYQTDVKKLPAQVETYNCTLCPFISMYKSALVAHQRQQHKKNPTMYKCKKCSFTTKYKLSLVKHRMVHPGPKMVNKFECVKCPYQTKRQSNLSKHMKTHSVKLLYNENETYKCELCSYQGKTTEAVIKAHIARHRSQYRRGCGPWHPMLS